MSSTNVIMYEAYKSTFLYVDRERGAAMVTVLLIMIALVVALQFYVMGERRERSKGVRL